MKDSNRFKCIEALEDYRLEEKLPNYKTLESHLDRFMAKQEEEFFNAGIFQSEVVDCWLDYLLDNLEDSVLKKEDRKLLEKVINLHGYIHFY